MKLNIFPLFVITLILGVRPWADEVQKNCNISDYASLVACANKQSADVKLSNQKTITASNLEAAAGQWINPELDFETVSKGSNINETSATLFFNIPIGGKISSKKDEARAEYQKTLASSELEIQNYRLGLSLAFYRLAQIQREIKIEQESGDTFNKIIKQYAQRSVLSPEQEVSLTVFKMALADHQLSLIKLQSNAEKIYKELSAVTKIDKEIIRRNLPPVKMSWAKVDQFTSNDESPQLRAARAEVAAAKSVQNRAEADSWPDLKVGPTVKTNKTGSDSETLSGLSVSMPLPVLSLNKGAREYSKNRVIEAELSYENTKNKTAAQKEYLIQKYNTTVQVLQNTLNPKTASERHDKLEKQFFKGVVPSSLIVEAHRQMFELESKRNESELEALEAYGQILILENKFSEVVL